MKAVQTLPEGYREHLSIDLQKDKKAAVLVNGFALVIAAVMVLVMQSLVPIASLLESSQGLWYIAVIAASCVAYIVLHEATHGIAMKLCGTKKVKFGFTGLYAFAGSEDYYDKSGYLFIALAPVVLWGAVLAVINALVPYEWIWAVYIVQIMNLSGAAGDLYVTVRFCRLPREILVKDSGTSMTVWSKEE